MAILFRAPKTLLKWKLLGLRGFCAVILGLSPFADAADPRGALPRDQRR
ncbi:MAG: hypothetical protein U5K74_07435 [Gemmatimonadaceae bacterium]|nr:hypothetical protein [Gemmatimonadaceae bacterium]